MRKFSLFGLLGLVSCTGTSAPGQSNLATVLCANDQILQPVAVAVATTSAPATGQAAPSVAAAISADNLIVHPSIVAACAQLNAKPLAIIPPNAPAGVQSK